MQTATSPAAQWATEGTEYPYRGGRTKTPIVITDRFRIAAAHSSALAEKAYRECRVYGMGTRRSA